jgi:hypothetical protein
MNNGPHWRAAELHDLAAHAHRTAATHHDKEDHQTGHEHSKQAMEHAGRAYQYSQQAHQESASSVNATGKNEQSVSAPAKQTTERPKAPVRPRGKRSGKKG